MTPEQHVAGDPAACERLNANLGERLRQWREANGLTAADVAQRLGWKTFEIEMLEEGAKIAFVMDGRRDSNSSRNAIEALMAQPAPVPSADPGSALPRSVRGTVRCAS